MAKTDNGITIAGAILAGGKASRMQGRVKGLLDAAAGVSIIEKQMNELVSSGISEVIIAADDSKPYKRFRRKIVPDLRPGIGPLGGIEAALSYYSGKYDATLFLPCDLPGITAREIHVLRRCFIENNAAVAVAAAGRFFCQPLCAVVHNGLLDSITAAIDKGARKPRELWGELGAVTVNFDDPAPFFNINTEEDLARWEEAELKHCIRRSGLAVRSKIWFVKDDKHVFGPGLARLLEGIEQAGTLRQAARAAKMSYRHAWNEIKSAEKRLGRKLIQTHAGGSGGGQSELSSDGKLFLRAFMRLSEEVASYADKRFAHHFQGDGGCETFLK